MRRTERLGELGALVHIFHRAGSDVQVVPLNLAGSGGCLVDRLHAVQESVAPVHERLRVDVLVVLHEVETALQRLVHDPAVVAAGKAEFRLRGGAQQRPSEFVEPLALDDDARGGSLERLQVRHRDAHVFEAQRLDRLEAEYIADDRCGEVGDRARLEQVEVVRDVGEVLLFGRSSRAGIRHGIDAVRLRPIEIAGGEPVGPHHRPCRGGRFARDRRGRFVASTPACGVIRNSATTSVSFGS